MSTDEKEGELLAASCLPGHRSRLGGHREHLKMERKTRQQARQQSAVSLVLLLVSTQCREWVAIRLRYRRRLARVAWHDSKVPNTRHDDWQAYLDNNDANTCAGAT